MGWNNLFYDILQKLARVSPLAWASILMVIAFLLIQIDVTFIKRLAIAPLIIAILLFYQAFWRGKM